MVDLLSHFPYPEPREMQKRVLELLGSKWDTHDVIVIDGPTAFGKTGILKTLMNAFQSVSALEPTNQLVDQVLTEFPDTPTLHRLDSYQCPEWQVPCSSTRNRRMHFCKGCPAGRDLATAKFRSGPGVYNYYTYLAHRLYRKVLVVDEAHNLLHTISDRNSLIGWRHNLGYPAGLDTPEKQLQWIMSLSEKRRNGKFISHWEDSLRSRAPQYIPHLTREEFNGKGTKRGEPEMRDCVKLVPVDISNAPPIFWPKGQVEKVVLLSATINARDIAALGLDRRRVLYINCESPIPAERRPIVVDPCISLASSGDLERAIPRLARYIEQVASQHPGDRGVVHATYGLSMELQKYLIGPRYIFHDRGRSKMEAFSKYRSTPGAILVACGMQEGIDLVGELGTWQVIAKVPWPNLTDPAVAYHTARDPEWLNWETARITMQAAGRICRTPTDFGVTVIPDSSFSRLLRDSLSLFPQWFLDGITEGDKLINPDQPEDAECFSPK